MINNMLKRIGRILLEVILWPINSPTGEFSSILLRLGAIALLIGFVYMGIDITRVTYQRFF